MSLAVLHLNFRYFLNSNHQPFQNVTVRNFLFEFWNLLFEIIRSIVVNINPSESVYKISPEKKYV